MACIIVKSYALSTNIQHVKRHNWVSISKNKIRKIFFWKLLSCGTTIWGFLPGGNSSGEEQFSQREHDPGGNYAWLNILLPLLSQ